MSKAHWVALASVPGVGGKTVTRLLAHFGSVSAIFAAPVEELAAVPRLGAKQARAIASLSLEHIEARMSRYEASGIRLITWEEPEYPANLLLINDAPPLLTVRGDLRPIYSRAVAIIGTRDAHPASLDIAFEMAGEFARLGWTVVVTILLYPVFQSEVLARVMFGFPELVVAIIGVLVWIGGYTGYRLSELIRFRSLVAPEGSAS